MDFIKPLKVSSKLEPLEGSIFWALSLGPWEPQKPTLWDSHFLLVCCNECCVQVIASDLGCVHRLHKPLKISSKPKPPQGPHFWALVSGTPKTRKTRCLSVCNVDEKQWMIASDLGCVHRLHTKLVHCITSLVCEKKWKKNEKNHKKSQKNVKKCEKSDKIGHRPFGGGRDPKNPDFVSKIGPSSFGVHSVLPASPPEWPYT